MTGAEKLARAFHENYERLAPEYGYETREETKTFDTHTPNGKLMIAVCAAIIAKQPTEIVVSDRENKLYEIFKGRLMDELKIVGYRLVKLEL